MNGAGPGRFSIKEVLAFVWMLGWAAQSAVIGADAELAGGLRVATYNVQNYLIMDRRINGQWRPAYPKPEKEKTALRQVIHAADADILLLQEMGPMAFLMELRQDLAEAGLVYPFAYVLEGPDAVRHLAVLSKIEPVSLEAHTDFDFKYFDQRETVKRGLLELGFESETGFRFQIFSVHLKSRFTDYRPDPQSNLRRTREAEACRNRIIERTLERGETNYLIAGDFNDHRNSSAMRRFFQRGALEIGALVPAVDSRGELWTYYFAREGRYELIDGFIASSAMQDRIHAARGGIVDIPQSLEGSDHRLVYVDLEID